MSDMSGYVPPCQTSVNHRDPEDPRLVQVVVPERRDADGKGPDGHDRQDVLEKPGDLDGEPEVEQYKQREGGDLWQHDLVMRSLVTECHQLLQSERDNQPEPEADRNRPHRARPEVLGQHDHGELDDVGGATHDDIPQARALPKLDQLGLGQQILDSTHDRECNKGPSRIYASTGGASWWGSCRPVIDWCGPLRVDTPSASTSKSGVRPRYQPSRAARSAVEHGGPTSSVWPGVSVPSGFTTITSAAASLSTRTSTTSSS